MQKYRTEHPEQPILYLDAGRAFPLKSQETDVVIPHTVEAYQFLGLDVMNAGDEDMDAGFSILSASARSGHFQAISANLVTIDEGKPVLPPYVMASPRVGTTAPAGAPRIAVVGLTQPGRYRVFEGVGNQKLHFMDPLKIADQVLPKARAESDLLIVLANMGMGPSRLLVERHPEIDLVIAADEDQYDVLDMIHNEVPVIMTGIQGKYVIRLDLFRQSGKKRAWRVVPEMTQLNANVQPDPDAARFMQRFQAELEERARQRGDTKKDPRYPDFVGAAACAGCHAEASTAWAASRHAHAWEPLEKNEATMNPLCFQCHTVGYLKPNGFYLQNRQPELASVGCEACHGPGGNHVKDPFRTKLARGNEETCRSCHTTGQSPGFNFAEFWPRIKHGL
jgi:hypothetical protein